MPNIFAPFGFAESHRLGAAPDFQMGGSRRYISNANANPIYFGDPVASLATGFIAQAAVAAPQIAGIFAGCTYISKSLKRPVWSPWWSGATGDVNVAPSGSPNFGFDIEAKIIDDPLAVFRIQGNGLITQAMIGMNALWVFGNSATAPGTTPAPNQMSGFSNVALDITGVTNVPAVTATYPFRILELIRDPPGVNGTDPTTAYNWAFVTFNNQDFKSLTGI